LSKKLNNQQSVNLRRASFCTRGRAPENVEKLKTPPYLLVLAQVGAMQIAKQGNFPVALVVLPDELRIGDVLHSVDQQIRVRVAPREGSKFLHADVTSLENGC
jgi:hypothetical protein